MKVLICEDEEIMLTALEFRLKKQGYQVLKAKDGREALEVIKSETPDMIIADILMPHVTGLEIIEYVRKDLKRDTPPGSLDCLKKSDALDPHEKWS